jgi:hypothetical protein
MIGHRMTLPDMLRPATFLLISLLVAVLIVEAVLVLVIRTPPLAGAMPRPVRLLFQQVYRHFERSIVQFEPACARYDPELTYTLEPGSCTFENAEFSTELRVNRAGLRDDDASLEAPQVIVLGDSHAMGWGVQQDETLARVLARKTGLRVLNAGVSSYGTVRELRLLGRLDTSALETLIVQYNDTDALENWTFREHGGSLPVSSEADYQQAVRQYLSQQGYYPGKYNFRLFTKLTGLEAPEPNETRTAPVGPAEEAELFVDALVRGGPRSLEQARIIVFEINEQIRPPRPFIAALAEVSRRAENPPFIRRLRALDVAPLLTEDDFYDLDDHMRPSGHEAVAGALASLLQSP